MTAQGELVELAMRELARRHAAHLQALGPVRVLALDPCPRCAGNVVASESSARCVAGCGWSYEPSERVLDKPIASRRADP